MKNMKKIYFILLIFACTSCNWLGAGTLGTFQQYYFIISEKDFEKEITKFYVNNPQYIIPEKWKELDNWNERGFGVLNGKIFYFKSNPEEIYYVTYHQLGDDFTLKEGFKTIDISVRAVHSGELDWRWLKEKDFNKNEEEKKRIEDRFYNEIILKLEKQFNLKAIKND